MPKEPTARRHAPLHEELLPTDRDGAMRKMQRTKRKDRSERQEDFVESGLSRKILEIAREQQDEIEQAEASAATANGTRFFSPMSSLRSPTSEQTWEDADSDDEFEGESFGDGEYIEEVVEVDEDDLELFNKFMPNNQQTERLSLADKILEKIAEHEAAMGGGAGDESERPALPPKVVEVYTKVGLLLSRYKSGKLPKAFKIIPTLRHWEEILFLTRPDQWSPNACYEATRLFSSQKGTQCQKFLSLVLLDRVRDDIHENKKLNVHLYKCLKKSLYKPAAFFKGFLFPLCQSGTCTLKEAQIIGSVLTRVSVPVLHSAAALLRLAEMDYTGPTSVFIRVLLDKKYALPYKVVDAVVFHFLRFKAISDPLPLLWHKSFLAFAQRYKNDITEDQRDALLDLLLIKGHPLLTPEIRRELLEGRGRGVPLPPKEDDDTMMDI